MTPGHSTLELVKHDETATAPERDNDATAFELDASRFAPEVLPATLPQVLYDTSLPEPYDTAGELKATVPGVEPTKTPSFRIKWMTIVIIVMVVIAVGVGVGLGIWQRHKHLSQASSENSPPSPSNSNNSSSPPSPTNSNNLSTILINTSLAAITLSNNERNLFFQNNEGVIRQAVRSASSDSWVSSPYLNVMSSAKFHTPLTATAIDGKAMLFYITHNHSINVRAYSGWGWETGFDLGIHATAPDSRHISVTSVTDSPNLTANATADLLFLFYESPGGNVTALLATALMISGPNDSTPCRSFRVRDISSSKSMALPPYVSKSGCYYYGSEPGLGTVRGTGATLYDNRSQRALYDTLPGATFGVPFTSHRLSDNSSQLKIDALFYAPSTSSILSTLYNPTRDLDQRLVTGYLLNNTDIGTIRGSDIAPIGTGWFSIWINHTEPTPLIVDPAYNFPLPKNAFPFSRLASAISADTSLTYLYHQMNGTTFAEEIFDKSLNIWLPTVYITVSDS